MSLKLSKDLTSIPEFVIMQICGFDAAPEFEGYECPYSHEQRADGECHCPLYYEEYDITPNCTTYHQIFNVYTHVLQEKFRFEEELKRQWETDHHFDTLDMQRYNALNFFEWFILHDKNRLAARAYFDAKNSQ